MISLLLRVFGREHRGLFARFLLSTVVYSLAEGAAFGLLVPLLTDLLGGHTTAAAWWLVPLGAAVAVGWVAHYVMGLTSLGLASAWRRTLYDRLGTHVVRLPLGWFTGTRTAQLQQLLGKGVDTAVRTATLLQTLVGVLVTPATIFVVLLFADWRVALAVLVTVPVVLLAFALAARLTTRTEAAEHAAAAEAGARLVEFAGAQPVLRANGRSLLGPALDEQYRTAKRSVWGALPGQNLGQLAIQLAFTAVLVVGLLTATGGMGGTVAPARIVAVLVLGLHFLQPFAVVAGVAGALRASRAALERIEAVLTTEPLPEPDVPGPIADASAELRDVRFGYGETPVLDGFSLTVPAGTTTALVGPSGAGKTTVTKLVARFFDVQSGSVRVGGTDVRELSTVDLMDAVSLVFQDVHLFDGTIEDNIRLGRPGASRAEVLDAARRAQVVPIAERLPGGWAARVGEAGRLLSGGERQRVAIARTLLKDTPIVLLDEATSALDAENEAAIHEALRELAQGRTLLVIAHRLTTIAEADQIAVLDGGRVAETGRHDELLAAGGRYAALWAEHERAQGWRLTGPDHRDLPS